MRNIEESVLRLRDIRRMKKEGVITNNDVLRSEMQLTNDRLSLQETENSIVLVSQQLDILLGQDENLLLKPDTTLLHQAVASGSVMTTISPLLTQMIRAKKLLRKQRNLPGRDPVGSVVVSSQHIAVCLKYTGTPCFAYIDGYVQQ